MLVKVLTAVIVALASSLIYVVFRQTSVKLSHTSISNGNSIESQKARTFSSSVWCHYDKTHNKICTFKNLCYLPEYKSFMFILTNDSVTSGLKSKNDLKSINLSSVDNHNDMLMRLQIVFQSNGHLNRDNFVFIHEPVFLIKRFKSDNIMHIIHDDVLPIYMTYNHLCAGNIDECIFNNRLMFIDNNDDNNHIEWYNLFSYKKPFNLKNLKSSSCFDKISVGLSRETVWFQYGFGTPQGPVKLATINSLIIDRFNDFILNKFNIKKSVSSKQSDDMFIEVVLFSRKNNRKILNENFIMSKITETYRSVYPEHNKIIQIHILDPSHNKSSDILNVVTRSRILIGMHGSAMIYSLFLPKTAAIVELFPFGIQPQHVSSTRALCQLPGIFYNYLSWRNFKEANTVTHPERPPLLGGIKHLPDTQQERIKQLKTIPAVECCHDPAYLYRMFQDTIVDDSFEIILKQALINQKEMSQVGTESYFNEYMKSYWFFPGTVRDISCNIDKVIGKVQIDWREPFNTDKKNVLITGSVLYQVTIKVFTRIVTVETFSSTVSVKLTEEEINSGIQEGDVQIWIKAMIDQIEGTDVHSHCNIAD